MINDELNAYKRKIKILNKIGVLISKEKDIPKLLNIILEESLNLTNSDAGSIYFKDTVDGEDVLLFKCSINKSNDSNYIGNIIKVNNNSISGQVALTGETVVIDDCSKSTEMVIDKSFDKETGYETMNMIVVPMKNERGKVVGIFQILNKISNSSLENRDISKKSFEPFNEEDQEIIASLASQSAILVERIILNDLLRRNVNITRTTLIKFFNSIKQAVSIIGEDILIEQEEFKEIASLDKLTGLMTRKEGLSYLEKQLEFCQLNSIKLVLAFIDINNLKTVNDNYGHIEGDILIKTVVDLIQEAARDEDFIFRYGGDEFVLCILNANYAASESLKNRIYKKFAEYNKTSKKPYSVSASFGFAEYNHIDNKPIDELIELADKEMYKEKRRLKEQNKKTWFKIKSFFTLGVSI